MDRSRRAPSSSVAIRARIRALQPQVSDRKEKLRDPAAAALAAKLAGQLAEIEESLYQARNRSPRDTLNYPIKLNNQLAVLQRLVNTGDYPPTAQTEAVFLELRQKLNQIRDTFQTALAVELKRLNEILAGHGLDPVK